MRRHLVAVALFLAPLAGLVGQDGPPHPAPPPAPAPAAPPADALAAALTLARDRFAGFVYGPGIDAERRTVDCTCFVWAVIEDLAGRCGARADAALRRAVLIANIDRGEDLAALVDADDPRIRGVVTALVDAGLGTRVDPAAARPGDFVQYWYRPRRGATTWAGHAAMVESIDDHGVATLLGSHKTTLHRRADGDAAIATERGGIGSGPRFDLRDPTRVVYVVRWTAPLRARPPRDRDAGR